MHTSPLQRRAENMRSIYAMLVAVAMFSLMVVGVILWLVYGVAQMDAPIIAANTVTLLLSSVILFFKLKYK